MMVPNVCRFVASINFLYGGIAVRGSPACPDIRLRRLQVPAVQREQTFNSLPYKRS